MKPIRLVLAGLNSFKEQQELDFRLICDGRVFGIFGPTGSGKSTIIDAITLALYGKVERAQRGVQGIINKGVDHATVLFEFELSAADGHKSYRVERKYVAKEDTISCRLARLVEINGGEEKVIADKPTHVDEQIRKILGLTVDDFTRAVVLPQGKFAEFLSLKGKERREMLERIFNLSDYGERLVGLTSAELKEVDGRVGAVVSEQQGLGKADEDAVRQGENECEQAQLGVVQARKALDEATALRDGAKAVVELHHKLMVAEQHLAAIELESPRMALTEQRLERVSAAAKVAPFAYAYTDAATRLEEAGGRLAQATEKQSTLLPLEMQCAQSMQEAKEERQQQEPLLLSRLRDLERALSLEQKATALAEQEQALLVEEQALRASTQKCNTELSQAISQEAESSRELLRLATVLTENVVSPEERAALRQALSLDMAVKQTASQLQAVQQELFSKELGLKSSMENALGAVEKKTATESSHSSLAGALAALTMSPAPEVTEEMYACAKKYSLGLEQLRQNVALQAQGCSRVASLQADLKLRDETAAAMMRQQCELAEGLQDARRELSSAEQEYEEAQKNSMASLLATSLVPGQSCPVCGSKEHPAPVRKEGQHLPEESLRRARDQEQKIERSLVALGEQIGTIKRDLAENQAQLEVAQGALLSLHSDLTKLLTVFPQEWCQDPFSLEVLTQHVALYDEGLRTRSTEQKQYVLQLEKLRDQEKQESAFSTAARHEAALAEQRVETLKVELAGLRQKQQEAVGKGQEAMLKLQDALDAMGVLDLDIYADNVDSRDKQHREVSANYKDVESRRDLLQQKRQEQELEFSQLREKGAVLSVKCLSIKESRENLLEEIRALTAGNDALQLLRQAEGQLKQLQQREEQKQRELDILRRELESVYKEFAASTEAHLLALQATEKTSVAKDNALRETDFESVEQLLQTLEFLPKKGEWEQELEDYKSQRKQALSETAKLRGELLGKRVSEEEWGSIVEQVEVAKSGYDQAVSGLGRAESVLGELKKRHGRWKILEDERLALVIERDMLAELVSLLRGNALVEFMATEQLHSIAGEATQWLRLLTHNRYALEVDVDGSFVIRDDGDGGLRRPVHTLSGGETFVASLALALSLSAQIQLRGRYPLEFFFLDEGFGSLDPELLDVVMSCLERMQGQRRSIGIISHVPELRERIQRKVLVTPAERGGRGSLLKMQ